jgi:hypothetical protein
VVGAKELFDENNPISRVTPLAFSPRFRGFLEFFPPACASFSSEIRGDEKNAFATRLDFLGENATF